MITYELALELKNAGFPQGEPDCYTFEGEWIPENEREYVPTLSELIEACGDRFRSMEKHYGQIGATNHKTPWYGATSTDMKESMVGETGFTPEEAVARLWLALNK